MKNDNEAYLDSLVKQVRAMFRHKDSADFVDYLCERLTEWAETAWQEYLVGKRETYRITAAQFRILYKTAAAEYAHVVIEEAMNQGKLQASVNRNGELVYKLREDGDEKI